ncbi:MAG: hypothetical protein ACRDN0_10905, partial [Trebonia sp.]
LHTIEASPVPLKNPASGRAIAAALARDYNPFWTKAQRKKALLGEGFAEFYGDVIDLLLKHYGLRDPVILRVLALGAYVPGSRMSYILAGQGSRVMPYALELWRRGPNYNQAEALSTLGLLVKRCRDRTLRAPLVPRDRREIAVILRQAAANPQYIVRDSAVDALRWAGGPGDIGILRRVAAHDPVCVEFPHPPNICSDARLAIRAIRRRTAKKKPGQTVPPR